MSTMTRKGMTTDWYDIAQVCLNGHSINSRTVSNPEHNKDFCIQCGSETITTCQQCGVPIKGYYHLHRGMRLWSTHGDHFSRPSFCEGCGRPFPWTEEALKAAQDLADEVGSLSREEKELLRKSLNDIVRDTPQTAVASARFKRLAAKGGKEAAEGFKQILISIATETAKKMIWQ
jgi:hypothetical protein